MYLIERGPIEKYTLQGKTYSGIMHPVRFRVNRPLKITGLQFCGLHSQSKGTGIILGLKITESMYNDISRTFHEGYMACTYFSIQGEQEEFAFKLPESVAVPPNTVLEIGFQLDPTLPEEAVCFKHLQTKATQMQEILHKESGVLFEFFQSSSQLRGLFFEINQDTTENQPSVPEKFNSPGIGFDTCCNIL